MHKNFYGISLIAIFILLSNGCDSLSTPTSGDMDNGQVYEDMFSLDIQVNDGETDLGMSQALHVEIELPMRPQFLSSEQLLLLPNELQVDDSGIQTYVVNSVLNLTKFEGYPDRFELEFLPPILVGCGQTNGGIEWQEIESDAISQITEDGSIMIERWPLGRSSLTLLGVYQPTPDDIMNCADVIDLNMHTRVEVRYEMKVDVPAQLSPSSRPRQCDDSIEGILLANSLLDSVLGVQMLNIDGEVVGTRNAESRHNIPLQILAPQGTELQNPDKGLAGIHLGMIGGLLSVVAPFGEPLDYMVISTQEVTGWSIEWSIAGMAGGGISELEDGSVYQGPWSRTSNRILPVMTGLFMRGNETICTSEINPDWFTINSATPEVCTVDESFYYSSEVGGIPIGHSVKLINDGECHLTLNAPNFNGDQGLTTRLQVTVTNVDQMIAVED